MGNISNYKQLTQYEIDNRKIVYLPFRNSGNRPEYFTDKKIMDKSDAKWSALQKISFASLESYEALI